MGLYAVLGALVVAAGTLAASGGTVPDTVPFKDDFSAPVRLGAFSGCDHNAGTRSAYCSGLRGWYRTEWWAYPNGWPDTATQRKHTVGGYYDPADTTWVSGGQLHIRMFRQSGPVHSSALVPKRLIGSKYGTYSERFRVSKVERGYKSAHLLWPTTGECDSCEIDFPEGEWTGTVSAFTHPEGGGRQDAFSTRARWSDWHTSVIEWKPGSVTYTLDGRFVGSSVRNVPTAPMIWVLQNESALGGATAPIGSSAQIDIDWVSAEAGN